MGRNAGGKIEWMLVAVLSGYCLAAAAPLIAGVAPRRVGWLIALLPLGLTAYFATYLPAVAAGEVFVSSVPWVPSLGVRLSFQIDGWGLLFALLISGIGAVVMVYAGGYLAGHREIGRFFLLLLLFMASMLGVVLADNVVVLFVFWELTSISSYFLIGFGHEQRSARVSALQALLVTGGGGLALLAGLLLLADAGGSAELSALATNGDRIRSHALYVPILVLVLLGAATKSAQVPFHFWLPNAMEAPTPVSAYLHSATMVKAGVYLLGRMSPMLGDTDAWHILVGAIGAITMVTAGVLALTQIDIKRVLAYSTISALGTLVLLLGAGTTAAVSAAVVFLLAHALYKGALFMVAGAVDHETGTRDLTRLGGLRTAMPITAATAVLAAVALAGVGPVLSFVGKEMLLDAVLELARARALLAPVVVVASALFVAAAALVVRPFFGARRATPKDPHEAPPSLWLGPAILAGLGLLLGLVPFVAAEIVAAAVSAVSGEAHSVELALWHGLNFPLAMSVMSLALGFAVYSQWDGLREMVNRQVWLASWGPDRWYDRALAGLRRTAAVQTRALQSGYLRGYVMIVILTTIGLVGYTLGSRGELLSTPIRTEVRFYEAALGGLVLAAAFVAVRSRSRLATITALGVVGYGIALLYVMFGAPDLAMTQILIETLSVLLYVLVLYHLPRFAFLTSQTGRMRDIAVALSAGAVMSALVLVAVSVERRPTVATYFAENSVPAAHGRNIVNVILVDFRSLDTLGEITVLALAAVGVYALLRLRSSEDRV